MIQVLIVDDEKLEREGIKYLLAMEEGEWNIREASNGRDALQILKNEETDLLLTDIKMPHMDGLELTSKAKEMKPGLQVVIFSGYSDFTFAQEAIRYGVTEYMLKPVEPDHKYNQKKYSEEKRKGNQRAKGTGLPSGIFSGKLFLYRKKGHSGKIRRNDRPGKVELLALCDPDRIGYVIF